MFKIVIFFIFFICNILVASSVVKIEGITSNVIDGSLVQLIQYKYSDVEIARRNVSLSNFNFNLVTTLPDGIYSFILTEQPESEGKMYKYNIIIDKSEKFS